jgi:hypothetical protein
MWWNPESISANRDPGTGLGGENLNGSSLTEDGPFTGGPIMQLPKKDEINVYGSLDEKRATEHFLGKTLEQAKSLFRMNNLCYFEDLMWMGPKAFNF